MRPKPVAPARLLSDGDEVGEVERHAVQRDRHTLFEADRHLERFGRADARERVGLVGRVGPRVLDGAALDSAAPEVLVDRVDLFAGRANGDLPLLGEVDRVGAGHSPVARRREHFEVRRQGVGAHLEANLVVALTRAAVRHRLGVKDTGLVHEVANDHRTRQGRDEGILTFVLRVRGDGLRTELLGHLAPSVHDDARPPRPRLARAP